MMAIKLVISNVETRAKLLLRIYNKTITYSLIKNRTGDDSKYIFNSLHGI